MCKLLPTCCTTNEIIVFNKPFPGLDGELGIEAIGMFYWDRLNPLLERAYALMDVQTLNAPFLTR
jgi:hypothetical protein